MTLRWNLYLKPIDPDDRFWNDSVGVHQASIKHPSTYPSGSVPSYSRILSIMVMERKARSEHGEQAYQVQKDAGIRSMITWTIGATIATVLAHNTWPLFRKQTLPFKAFLISSATMSGLVIGAEGNLQEFEKNQKKTYNMERRWAKVELAKEGRIATEYEIARWIADHPPSSYPSWSSLAEGKPFAYNSPSTDPTSSTSTPASASVLASAPTGSVSLAPTSDDSSQGADPSSQVENPTQVVQVQGVKDPLVLRADKEHILGGK